MNTIVFRCLVIALLQLFSAVSSPAFAAASQAKRPVFLSDTLTLQTAKAALPYTVELARSPAEQQFGLMYRTSMADDHGMLFLWPQDESIGMWMKNTKLSLDMFFLDAQGKIIYIAERTTPESITTISPGVPIRGVLELKAGSAKKHHIALGDRVIHRHFQP